MLRWLKALGSKQAVAEKPESLRCAEERLETLERYLEQAHERTSEIVEISRSLRRVGEQNHFAARLRSALGGPGE